MSQGGAPRSAQDGRSRAENEDPQTRAKVATDGAGLRKDTGPGRPPAGSRFRKGDSGNPKGRPKSPPPPRSSAFDIVLDRVFPVTQNGQQRELSLEEALQLRAYQDAISGSRSAQRQVLRMIEKRERWLAAHAAQHRPPVESLFEAADPTNADEVLLLLDIAEPDPNALNWYNYTRQPLALRTWAVQAALSRPGRRRLSKSDVIEIKRATRDPERLRWPASIIKGGEDDD